MTTTNPALTIAASKLVQQTALSGRKNVEPSKLAAMLGINYEVAPVAVKLSLLDAIERDIESFEACDTCGCVVGNWQCQDCAGKREADCLHVDCDEAEQIQFEASEPIAAE